MIEKFSHFVSEGITLKVNLTHLDENIYLGEDKIKIKDFYNSGNQGLFWEYNGAKIVLQEVGFDLFGFPTPDLKKVIVIYPYNHSRFASPDNAVLYNSDGTINAIIKSPNLISEIAIEREKQIGKLLYPSQTFTHVNWEQDRNGIIRNSLKIDYEDFFWTEIRIFNYEMMDFGECIGSGRR